MFHMQTKWGQWKEDLKHKLNETLKTELKQVIEDAIKYEAEKCLRDINSFMASQMRLFDKKCLKSGRGKIIGQHCFEDYMNRLARDIESIVKKAQKCMGTENKEHREATIQGDATVQNDDNGKSGEVWDI
ncbi:hypothetical protein QAD02_010076 [Eretmocerus hayati]|uniref:Uncharacterized protein n=1 Tax=Eretmocerus hayati TaxID=131215 RepID=A0ACC2NBU0_9HYME|nr:hypothetical protein QAD02_010076 [Eretmocerus hayati]